MARQETAAIIVGGGPAGIATSACLNKLSIPNIVLEKQDIYAATWKQHAYDCVCLHVAKHACELPDLPFPPSAPTYLPKQHFIDYLDAYVTRFNVAPLCRRAVESAAYDEGVGRWNVKARVEYSGEVEEYSGRFLVVATGESTTPYIPEVKGIERFSGEVLHSTQNKNGDKYRGKNVLVVGCGNSGMEIANDVCNFGAKTSIVVRSPSHIFTRGIVYMALKMFEYHVPNGIMNFVTVMLSKLIFGDIKKYYGVGRPKDGPFTDNVKHTKFPVIDVGTHAMVKSGHIQVLPSLVSTNGCEVVFENGNSHPFDVIIFATGFKRTTNQWLQSDDYLLDEDGLPKPEYPMQWKGKNGLYCVGLSRKGFFGISFDSQNIANDIKNLM